MRRLGVVGLVLAGFYAIIQALLLLPSIGRQVFGSSLGADGMPQSVALDLLAFVLVMGAGVVLIALRERLASRWFSDGDITSSIDGVTLLQVGLIVVGIVLIIESVPAMVLSATSAILQGSQLLGDLGPDPSVSRALWLTGVASVLIVGLRLVLGIVLLVRAPQLAVRLMRPARVSEDAPANSPEMAECLSCGAEYRPSDYRVGVDARCAECHELLPRRDA